MIFKKSMAIILAFVMLIAMLPIVALSADVTAEKGNNIHSNTYDRWANPETSKIYTYGGKLYRAEYIKSKNAVTVEEYSSSFAIVSKKLVSLELPIFGGIFIGSSYNFIISGQLNEEESDSKEVIRVTKYSKDWNRLGSASLFGENTTVPFDAGRVSAAEYGDYIYIRTAHEMYTSSDGLNHQANVTIIINTKNMTVTDKFTGIMNLDYGYVSHSFNQLVIADTASKSLITLDHGDAYPRSVVLMKFENQLGRGDRVNPSYVDLVPIAGMKGDNTTGLTLGGLEISSSSYLAAYSSIDQTTGGSVRNIYISAASKSNIKTIKTTKLTSYTDISHIAGTPHLVKIDDNKFLVIWENVGLKNDYSWVYPIFSSTVSYVFVDGEGKALTEVYTSQGFLSDCKPIVLGNQVLWYVTNKSVPTFMTIDLDNPSSVAMGKCSHSPAISQQAIRTCENIGTYNLICGICGEAFTKTVTQSGHSDANGDGNCDICRFPIPTVDASSAISWDKAYYEKGTQTATMKITGANIKSVDIAGIDIPGSFSSTEIYLDISKCSEGQYTVYLVLSDGSVAATSFTIGTPKTVHEHNYAESTVEATCEHGGYVLHSCSCGYSYKTNETDALEHSYVKISSAAATCEKNAIDYYECSVCKTLGYSELKDTALGHDFVEEDTIPATCTSNAVTKYKCSRCEETKQTETENSALDHNFVEEDTIPATCTSNAVTKYKCSRCEETKQTETENSALGHDWVTEYIAPTCTSDGGTVKQCSRCDNSIVEEASPATGHSFGDWETVTPATDSEKGLEKRVCSICGEAEERDIAPNVVIIKGDINGDGKVTAVDARIILRLSAKLEKMDEYENVLLIADIDGNGRITAVDARRVLRASARLEAL